jgi:hypothetical protein
MFYTQAKDGEASDTSSTKSRSTSQTSNVYVEEHSPPLEAEGFICPTCMASFFSQDDLQSHYLVVIKYKSIQANFDICTNYNSKYTINIILSTTI